MSEHILNIMNIFGIATVKIYKFTKSTCAFEH